MQKGNADPIQQGARWDQLVAGVLKENAAVSRLAGGRHATDAQLQERADRARGQSRSGSRRLAPEVQPRKPVTLGVSEPFMQTLKVSAYAGLLLALPIILYEAYAFVLPAFSPREREVALPAMLGIPFLFIAGVVFGYFTVVPKAIQFLQNFNTDSFDVFIQAQPYYKFVIMLLAAMALLFQIPIGIVAITRVGIVSHEPARAQPPLRDPGHRRHRRCCCPARTR